jgi:hypothetical protein
MNILPLPCWVVVVTTILTIAGGIAATVWFFMDDMKLARMKSGLCMLLGFGIGISCLIWLIIAGNQREIDYTEVLEVKVVTFPSGKSAQMFYADGKNINANEHFGGIVPEDSVVERVVYKKEYCGIYYRDLNTRSSLKDTYRIVKKK